MPEALWRATSKLGNSIRLAPNVWFDKIIAEHPEFSASEEYVYELQKAIEDPEYIIEGWQGEYLALRWCKNAPANPKYLCVVYREYGKEGFIITAFFISRYGKLLRRKIKWRKQAL